MRKKYNYLKSAGLLAALLLVFVGSSIAQTTVQIGTGTTTNTNYPIYSCYGYNYSQQIYTAAEITAGGGQAGQITKIRFYYDNGGTTTTNWNNWTVYLGNTAQTALASTSGWIPVGSMTNVFSGTISPVAGGWNEITLSTPFAYDGTNLVVAVDENSAGYSCTAAFRSFTATASPGSTRRSLVYYSDGTNPDPASPPTANASSATDRAQFQFDYCPNTFSAPLTTGTSICSGNTATVSATNIYGANGAINWYDAASSGNLIGTGSSFTTPALVSTTNYYATTSISGCIGESSSTAVTVSVTPVVLTLNPINASCTGYANGSFSLGTVTCGLAPFTYSVNGAAFGAIPTNLTAGSYTVIAKDNNGLDSDPIMLTIGTQSTVIPPAPVVAQSDFNFCSGVPTAPISAATPVSNPGTCAATATATGFDDASTTATVTNFSCASSGTITNATLDASMLYFGTPGYCTTDGYFSYNIIVNGTTVATDQCDQTGFNLTPYLPLTSVSIVSNDDDAWSDNVTMNLTVNLTYTGPVYSLSWYDAATAGNMLGTGSPLETIGTSVMPTATNGDYAFYVQTQLGGCSSTTRELVSVHVVDVNAVLTPVNATCNGANNGSFTLGAVECGVEPFNYSVNGGAFGAIPTDLTAGTYSVVIEDDNGLQSAPIIVVVTQPAAPSNITVSNINYYTADVSWTSTGNETQWTIEYGPAGFTPGTGLVETAIIAPFTLLNLTEDTQYDVYVTAVCGAGSQAGGPATFSTNAGFFTYDNTCGPGYNDISATGTAYNLGDDGETGFTLPWTLSYQGTNVTQLTLANNGGILFNTLTGDLTWTNGQMSTAQTGLYPFWDDIASASTIYSKIVGSAPNRQAIFQWNSTLLGSSASPIAFQVVIDEATNEIYFIYDDVIAGSVGYDYGASATIGAAGLSTDVQVSFNSATYLTNNSCVHFYNALCPNPVVTSVQAFQEDIILDWNAGAYGETEWTIIYGPAGFDPTTAGTTESGIMTSDFTISGLTQITAYDFYIYSECALDNLTSGGLLVEATTLPWCNTPTTLAGTSAVDSLFTTWNWSAVASAPNPLSGFNIQYGDFGFDLYNGTLQVATGLNNADTVANTAFLAGGVYQVYVQAVCGTDTSNYAGPYTIVMPLSNDTVCGAEMLSVDGTVYYFNNTGATVSTGEATIVPAGAPVQLDGYNNSILPLMTWGVPIAEGTTWFTFVAPASGSMWFSGEDENQFASQIAIYEASDCGDFTSFDLVAASDQVDETYSSKVAPKFTICGLTPGQTYYIMHDAWSNGFGGLPIYGQYSIKMSEIVLEAGTNVALLDVCTGSAVDLFDGITGYDTTGVWSSAIPAVGTGISGNDFNSAGLAYQTFDFQYRVTEGCAYDSIVAQVKIWAPSSAGQDGIINVCRNQPFNLLAGLTGTADLGGTWYNPSNVVMASSATTSSNIPGQFNYNYIAGNGVCPNDTALVLVNVSSTCDYLNVEEMFFGQMTIFPNPSNGVFNIANEGSTEVFNYEVTDLGGRIIATKDAAINGSTTTEINLTGKVTGVYMIRVFNDNAEKVFRVVLQ